MRTRITTVLIALTLAARAAYAQDPPTIAASKDPVDIGRTSLSGTPYGSVDFGFRLNTVTGDEARFQRYRDLRPGIYGTNALYGKRTAEYNVEAQAWNIGYRDQKYQLDFARVGRVTGSFMYDQIPLFISGDTRTLYTETAQGVFRIEDAVQQEIQAGTKTLRNFEDQATPFDLRTMRKIGQADLNFTANDSTNIFINVKNTNRNGNIPFGGTFGFSNAVEIPMPVDTRTTDVKTALEWANDRGLLRFGWDGSAFHNDVESVVWDNPLRYGPDIAGTPSQGRLASWPSNTLQYVNGTGAVNFPMRGRLTGYVAFGEGKSNETLLPMTINTAIQPIPLDRATAEAKQQMTIAQFTVAMRPASVFALNAKYRYADVDVQTPEFERTTGTVAYDSSFSATGSPSEYHSVKRSTFDIDGAIQVIPNGSIKFGYSNLTSDYTHRIWETTSENVFRASFDTTGNQYVMLRAQYEDRSRRGDSFDAGALVEAGEAPAMRHFDVADRDRKRFTLIADALPGHVFGFNVSAGIGRDEYPDSTLGLEAWDSNQYSAGVTVTPNDTYNFTAQYGWEDFSSTQHSRTASSAAEQLDPSRTWSMDYTGDVNYFNASFDIDHAIQKTLIRISADWNKTNDLYVYGVVPGGPNAAPDQLPAVKNELLRGEIDLTYDLSSNLKFGAAYWYEDYKVDDFALGPDVLSGIALPPIQPGQSAPATNALLLGYQYRPYTAHVGFIRLTYSW